ncbi:MAG: hypothetical protein U0T75_04980 [Chitinophagales bacterium]
MVGFLMQLRSAVALLIALGLLSVYGCNKELGYLHSNHPLTYTRINESPFVLYNGYGGKEMVIDRMAVFNGDDSLTVSNADYGIVSFRMTLMESSSENGPVVFQITGNKFTPELRKYLLGGHTCTFLIDDVLLKDKWGRPAKPVISKIKIYVLH